MAKRLVEVFIAGCPLCNNTVKLVRELACPNCEVQIYNLHMVKQHLHDLEHRIQEMQAFRQELATWYKPVEELVPDSTLPTQAVCQGQICGLIENTQLEPKLRNNETKNCSDC